MGEQGSSNSSIVFDPFATREDHSCHIESAVIIRLEDSGRGLCLECLQNSSIEEIHSINYELFENYAQSLFEILDENCDINHVRRIILPILERVLNERSLQMKNDHEFHNILRTIYKVRNHRYFSRCEFNQLVKILYSISTNFKNCNTVPLLSIWKASHNLIEYADLQIGQMHTIDEFDEQLLIFFDSLVTIVRSYLQLIRSFAIDKVADLIFPLSRNDSLQKYCRKTYIESQDLMLSFFRDRILKNCWPHLVSLDQTGSGLLENERDFVINLTKALNECLVTAIRLKREDFIESINEIDSLTVFHHFISRNVEKELRLTIWSFLRTYVNYFIEKTLTIDGVYKNLMNSNVTIETNYKNAMAVLNDPTKRERSISYLLINFVAMECKSSYFIKWRLERVLKIIQPEIIGIDESQTFVNVYFELVSSLNLNIRSYHNLKTYVKTICRSSRGYEKNKKLNETFCYNEKVFFWIHDFKPFKKVVKIHNIIHLLKESTKKNITQTTLDQMIRNNFYENLIRNIFLEDDALELVIIPIMRIDCGDESILGIECHKRLVSFISSNVSARLHHTIENHLNSSTSNTRKRLHGLIEVLIIMMNRCKHFTLMLDDQFAEDLVVFHKSLCEENSTSDRDETIILLNQFITTIIKDNNQHLMELLRLLNHHCLGYLLHFIADYSKGDKLAESVGSLLLAYDNLDYPLIQNICGSLQPMRLSLLNWMLSDDENLQILSIRIAKRLLKYECSKSVRACIATGLIHLLVNSPNISTEGSNNSDITEILMIDEFLHNPLTSLVVCRFPNPIKDIIEKRLDSSSVGTPDRDNLFSCSSSEHDSDVESIGIDNILSQLNEDDMDSCRIPGSLYLSSSIHDQHSLSFDTSQWEQRAYEMNQK